MIIGGPLILPKLRASVKAETVVSVDGEAMPE
jgi:hypothetical protein